MSDIVSVDLCCFPNLFEDLSRCKKHLVMLCPRVEEWELSFFYVVILLKC